MNVPLYEQVFQFVMDEIKSGRLKTGDRVPSEKELAEQFNVSRITSKKALEKLDQAKIIERVRGKGSFVIHDLPRLDALILADQSPTVSDGAPPRLIGLILPDFAPSYGLKLLQAIEAACAQHHCNLLMKRTFGRQENEEQAIQAFVRQGVEGLIVFPVHGEYYNVELLRLALDHFPLVLVDRYLSGIPTSTVHTDNRRAAYDVTSYLLDQGHEHLAFVSPPAANTSAIEERLEGFMAAHHARGLRVWPELCLTSLYSTMPQTQREDMVQQDQATLRTFMTEYPDVTGFVACEHNIAVLLAHVLRQMQKHIPDDVAIASFDSVELLYGPNEFTHIQQDETAMGQIAVDLLLGQLHGEPVALRTIVAHRLVEGASTRPRDIEVSEPISTTI